MSVIKVPYVAQNRLLAAAVSEISTFTYKLYQNNHTPANGDTSSSYTEATFTGYSAVSVEWGTAYTNGDNNSEIDATENPSWSVTGSGTFNTIYGYFVTNGSGTLLWAEKFDQPIFMNAVGSTFSVAAKFILRSVY